MEISAGWVTAGAAVGTLFVTVATLWIKSAFDTRDQRIEAMKLTQLTLFNKLDAVTLDLHAYKLHVAETYVADAKLQKMLDPIDRRLEAIEKDLRGTRHV